MVEFLSKYGLELVMSLITAGALAFCKYMHSQMKNYKKLLEEKDHDELNDEIDKNSVASMLKTCAYFSINSADGKFFPVSIQL